MTYHYLVWSHKNSHSTRHEPFKNLNLEKLSRDLIKHGFVDMPKMSIDKLVHACLENLFTARLSTEIRRNFATYDLRELVRIGKRSFRISIGDVDIGSGNNSILLKKHPTLKIRPRIKKTTLHDSVNGDNNDGNTIAVPYSGEPVSRVSNVLGECITDFVAEKNFPTMPRHSYFLPAARSGILQGHRVMSANIIKRAPHAGREAALPQMSGLVYDFLSDMMEMGDESKPLYDIATNLEKELFSGRVKTHTANGVGPPEIKYEYMGINIPLHRTSSTVSELAPLILYLKHTISKEGFLILEEPEAHLHPEMQILFAKYVAKLIQRGMKILITTHSVFFVECLSLLIQINAVPGKKRTRLNFGEDFLNPDQVAACAFLQDKSNGGYRTHSIPVSESEGISHSEFAKTAQSLYDTGVDIERYK